VPDLESLTAAAVYAVVCGLVFVECGLFVGFLLPGDTVLFAAGLIAAQAGSGVSMPLLAGATAVSAIAGEAVGYGIGRRAGRPLIERRAGRFVNRTNLARAEQFYARYGALALVAARFIPWVRTLAPLLAGAARMPLAAFWAANIVGGLIWGAGLIALGYFAAEVPILRHLSVAVAAIFVTWSVVEAVLRWRVARRRAARSVPSR
jgi:membrane-associated protein